MNQGNKEQQAELKAALNEVQTKIDTVEEKYFVSGEMSKETYEKLLTKFVKEKEQIMDVYKNCSTTSSNLDIIVEEAVTYLLKLATECTSSAVKVKERLQKLVFPEG